MENILYKISNLIFLNRKQCSFSSYSSLYYIITYNIKVWFWFNLLVCFCNIILAFFIILFSHYFFLIIFLTWYILIDRWCHSIDSNTRITFITFCFIITRWFIRYLLFFKKPWIFLFIIILILLLLSQIYQCFIIMMLIIIFLNSYISYLIFIFFMAM